MQQYNAQVCKVSNNKTRNTMHANFKIYVMFLQIRITISIQFFSCNCSTQQSGYSSNVIISCIVCFQTVNAPLLTPVPSITPTSLPSYFEEFTKSYKLHLIC